MVSVVIGLVGAGEMGTAFGAAWQASGIEVRTCLVGRSGRTARLVDAAGVQVVPSLEEVVDADIVASIVPPSAGLDAARSIAAAANRRGSSPLVADFNAIAPTTVSAVATELGAAGLELVDGSISGMPPRSGGDGTTVYLSGARADDVATTIRSWCRTVVLGGDVGMASALKMSTASMYKGTNALVLQAIMTASHHGVLDAFLADVSRAWPDNVPRWPREVALAAAKAARFADEMREIAMTQEAAGLSSALFYGVADVFEQAEQAPLAQQAPEAVPLTVTFDDVIERLRSR